MPSFTFFNLSNYIAGRVRHQVYTENSMAEIERLNFISQFIEDSQCVNFTATWALVVEWEEVHPFDHFAFVQSPSSFEGETAEFLNSVSLHKPKTFYYLCITLMQSIKIMQAQYTKIQQQMFLVHLLLL